MSELIESTLEEKLSNTKEHLRQYAKDGDIDYHASKIHEGIKVRLQSLHLVQLSENQEIPELTDEEIIIAVCGDCIKEDTW